MLVMEGNLPAPSQLASQLPRENPLHVVLGISQHLDAHGLVQGRPHPLTSAWVFSDDIMSHPSSPPAPELSLVSKKCSNSRPSGVGTGACCSWEAGQAWLKATWAGTDVGGHHSGEEEQRRR